MAEKKTKELVVINKFRMRERHEFDVRFGCPCHYIARMIKGEGRFISDAPEMLVKSGDYFYIPLGESYRSVWRGEDAIWWDSVGFITMPQDGMGLPMRKFTPGAEAIRLFDEIIDIGEVNCRSLGLLYLMMSEVIPSLKSDAQKPDPLIEKATGFMRSNCKASIGEVARFCNVSESGLYAAFRAVGKTPVNVRIDHQIAQAIRLIRTTDLPVEAIAEECGFGSANYLIRLIKKRTGKTTREFRTHDLM